MGARKKRQEEPCWQQDLTPTCKTNPCHHEHEANHITNPGRQANYNRANVKCSSCCNTIQYPRENDELTNNTSTAEEWPRVNDKSSPSPDTFPCLPSYIQSCLSISKICVKYLLKGNIRSRNSVKNEFFYYDKSQVKRLVHLLILLIVASSSLVVRPVNAVCVWQGGGGFKVACGFRQSGLFRIRSIGGVKGYVGAGFTIGDEDGFKDSLTNTEPQQSGAYVIPNNVHSQRSLPGPHNGLVGQYSQIYEHAIPIPTGDPAAQKYQKIQYLDNIQNQMESDHTNLQHMATDQQTQQILQQQLNLQGGLMPPPPPQPPAPTAKVKRAGTGLTKRASLWNWPNIFRGKNGKNGNKNKRPNGQRNGPPQGPNRRGGPPPPNHHNKQSKPPGKNGPPPGKNGPPPGRRGPGRRGPFPPHSKNPRQQQRPDQSSFINPMKNPFAHLQDNFIGKSNSQEAKQMNNFQQGQDIINQKFASGRNQFPPQPFTQGKNFFQPGQIPFSGENAGQLPQQFMMPPASPESMSNNVPKFKKIPNNQKPVDRQDDYVDDIPESQQQHYFDNQPPPSPTVDRMLTDVDDSVMQGPPPEYAPPSQDYMTSAEKARASLERQVQEAYEADPAGLKLLKQTENFGTIYHLINPDGSPVNMQFEKRPTVPPLVHFSSQQQQDLADELASVLPPPNTAEVGMGGEFIDSNLATAVYDPNIFPDIYFTTTEKHKHQDSQQNFNMFGGNFGLSQEQMDNPGFIDNQIKRILGTASAEKTGSGSSEGGGGGFVRQGDRRTAGAILRSNEVSSDQQQQVVMPRRKMRRRKKFRLNQQINNQVDTSEPDLTGPDASATPAPTRLPKRRRKGRRRKKYKLHTASPHLNDDAIASSTERMGLPANGADGGELTSSETKTETPTPDPLTTTPGPQRNVVIVTPTSPVAYSEDGSINLDQSNDINNAVAGNKKLKTSFTLPSNEDVTPTSTENLLLGAAGPSSENTINTSAGVTSSPKKASEETTTRMPMSFSTFGYFDALKGKNKNEQDDYDFTGPSGSGNYFGGDYDPRFPPGHEMNRGHNMSRFIRPRGQNSTGSTDSDDNSNGPFILYDMTGTRNQSRFSSKFHQETSSFRLDEKSDPNRVGNAYSTQNMHPFYTNNKQAKEKGVFLKLDSNEWSRDKQNSHYQNDHSSDPFSKHYNKTSLNNGGYYSSGASKEFRPSVEIPWERGYNAPSTPTTKSSFSFVGGSMESKYPKSGSDQHSIFGGPTMETFGLPKSSTPLSSSGEKQHKKLHKNLFGGSSADVSDLGGNWASPNFWGNLQEGDRYNPRVDFEEKKNNLKRLMTDFSSPNGLKEMAPVDLSSATPLPMPAPSSAQNTMEDLMDGPTYFLPPSTPGERWGKQRKRKGRPTTTAAPTTPSSIPFIMSTLATTAASPSSTSAAPSKWMAIMSNEVDMPPEYYDNISMMPPRSSSTEHKRNKEKIQIGKGIEIKFKSGEIRDPEEEEEQEKNQNNSSSTTAAASSQNHFDVLSGHGFPGVMVHDFDSSAGYGFGDTSANDKSMRGPPPPPPGMPNVHIQPPPGSDVSYFPNPNVHSDNRDRNGKVPSGPSVFPPMAQFGPPPTHNENDNRKSAPVLPGRQNNTPRREFVPSAEDLGPLPPMPPTTLIVGSGSGIPRHKDNPFKLFEKQNNAVNSNIGFVSATHELREMEDQISKFSKLPEGFLRRDSSEKKMGGGIVHAPNMDGLEFRGPPAPPPSSSENMNIPGFVTIPLPSIEQNPVHNMVHSGANPTSFGPSGFPSNLRDSEKASFSGPPSGHEEYQSPSMPPTGPAGGMHGHNAQHPGPPPGIPQDPYNVPFEFHPLDNNELGPPPSQGIPLDSEEEFRRHRPPQMREERPSGPPPHMRDERPSGPPPHMREERPSGPPPHMRDERPSAPPPHMREERPSGPPPHMREERPSGPPPHMREERPSGPPPHMREERPSGPPPHMREERPSGPPPHVRDGRPPGVPPHLRESRPPGPPPHMREERPSGPPPHMRDERPPPRLREDRPPGPPPHMRDGPPGPPHHLRNDAPEHLRPPPLPRDDHERRRPPHEDHPPMRPPPPMRDDHPPIRHSPPRDDHPSMRPPPREDHPPMRPPPREDHSHMRPPPREDHPPMRPPPREDHPSMRPPPREDHPSMRPPPREDHPSMRPPPREDHPSMRPPPREDHPPMRPPPREDHPPMRPPPRGNNHMRDEHPSRPPHPHRDERPGGPPGHREPERRPHPPPEFEREFSPPHPPKTDGPPRHHPEERFRDGPHHGHENNRPPPPRPGPPGGFFPDKPIDNHRPPPRDHFHDKPHEHRGEHSSFNNWQDDKDQFLRGDSPPNGPPTPHGMPDFLDIQKVPKKDQRPFKEPKDPFHHKHPPPPPGGKKPLPPGNPAKIPPQVFKPPLPPPKSQHSGNFFTNLLSGGPFGKHNSNKMHHPPPPRTHQMPPPPPNSRPLPPPPQNHPRKPPIPMPPQPDHFERDTFQPPHFQEHQPQPNNPNNYINSFNDRYEPPSAQHSPPLEDPNHKLHLRPELLPPPMPPHHLQEHAGSRLPFLPFPQRPAGSFETSLVDLDQDPHAHLLPPTLLTLPQQPHEEHPVRHHQNPPKETPRPVYQPKPTKKMDEKAKIKEAFETLNKANYDVIHSLAADQFGQKFIDKIKTKNNVVQEPLFPPTTTTQVPLHDMFASLNSKKATVKDENAQLAELWKMISNKSSNKHAQQMTSASTMGSHSPSGSSMESLSSLLQKLSKPSAPATTPPTTTTTTQRVVPELPSNPGLVSLTSLNHGSNHDIKSLQAQIAKAIIAKAHKKSHVHDQLEKPHYQPLQINAPANESPLNVLQQLAQNRHDTISQQTASKNYTASQLETLKKLLALNNLEEKLVTTPSTTTTENPLRKLQALLPAAIKAAKQPEYISSNTITRKMLDSTTAHSVAHRHNNHLQNADPTLLALKAIAMSKSQGINPQPSISLPQQVKPTEPSSQPIAVDLSAILSPSPPVVEAKRKRRLTNVRNAPKSFFPANATQGFEEYSGPLMTEFQCDEQSFFPGLYADTELGCRVFHLCAKTEAGYMMKSFRCPKETVFDQEVLRCNWNLFVECPASRKKYHFNKYLSQSFQFLKILGEFSANIQKSDATMTG